MRGHQADFPLQFALFLHGLNSPRFLFLAWPPVFLGHGRAVRGDSEFLAGLRGARSFAAAAAKEETYPRLIKPQLDLMGVDLWNLVGEPKVLLNLSNDPLDE